VKNAIRQHITAAIKHLDRLGSIFSPNEFAVYRWHIREQSKRVDERARRLASEFARLKDEVEKRKFGLRILADHERSRLSSATLSNYCRSEILPNGKIYVRWPTGDRLGAVSTAVERYLRFSGARLKRQRPQWKAFRLFDNRVPSVQLAAQVDELAHRAESILKEDQSWLPSARPLLWWLWLIGHPSAGKLLKFDSVAKAVTAGMKERIRKDRIATRRENERRWKQEQRCRMRRTI
jgi:hypothetical protein